MSDESQDLRLLEALLFASAEPLDERQLAPKLPEGVEVRALLERLSGLYANRGVNLVRTGQKWAFRTAPDLGPRLKTETTVTRRLSRAAIETLAIVAYHQPITRSEIEEVRGVGLSKGTLDILFEAGWIGPKGRRRTPGRPLTWATTDAFLDHFGLESLNDLPGVEELKAAGLLESLPSVPGQLAGIGVPDEAGDAAEDDASEEADETGDPPEENLSGEAAPDEAP